MAATQPISIRALVVDDDELIRALLSAFLEDRGYEVHEAEDGVAALEELRASAFNLLVTDWNMPRMDGVALCRAVRQLEASGYVYCIMLTSSSDEPTLVQAMEAGADDFVGKPLREAELGARLRAAERVLSLEEGLARRNRELFDAYDQVRRELDLARAMQFAMLPPPTTLNSVRFDWLFEASSFIAGDGIDYVALDEQHVCFHMIDVSGHGVSAAMMAFSAQHQIVGLSQRLARAQIAQGDALGTTAVSVVAELNRRLLEMRDTSLYLTMTYGICNARSGETWLVQAGHPPPLFSAAAGVPFEPVGDGGFPVGMLPDVEYEARRVDMRQGARLVLHSDGVTDCVDEHGDRFGDERLRELLSGTPARESLPGRVSRSLGGWRGSRGFEDDVTLLSIEIV